MKRVFRSTESKTAVLSRSATIGVQDRFFIPHLQAVVAIFMYVARNELSHRA